MIYRSFFETSKNVFWASISHEDIILNCNKTFSRLFAGKRCPKGDVITDYLLNWKPKASEEKVNIILKKSLIYDYVSADIIQTDLGFDIIGDFDITGTDNVLEKVSEINVSLSNMTREMNKKNKDLSDLLYKLKTTQSQLIREERMAGLGRIAGGVAHEINNPLGSIVSNFDYVVESWKSLMAVLDVLDLDKYKSLLPLPLNEIDWMREDFVDIERDIRKALVRIEDIVKAFRHYSEVDEFPGEAVYDFNFGLENTAKVLGMYDLNDVTFDISFGDLDKMVANGKEINNAITHLLINSLYAVRASDRLHKKIHVKTSEHDSGVNLLVHDNGCGMGEEVLEHACDPFYTTKEVGEGKGLGLTICRETFVHQYKGKMSIDSKEMEGTVVNVWIPYDKGDRNEG